ncbi:MAG: DUF4382 domain-containing protein [Halioglobus sp.]
MYIISLRQLILLPLFAAVASLTGCHCGFDCGSDDDDTPAIFSLGFSDASVESLNSVVIEVDQIVLRGDGVPDVVIDTFTIDQLDIQDAESFQVDLLDYRGRNQLTVIKELELERGRYSRLEISLLDNDSNFSFVEESNGLVAVLNGPAVGLSIEAFTLASGNQAYTVEFGLAQALQRQDDDSYLLSTEGVRVENSTTSASITGRVASELFDTASPCDTKEDPLSGNRVYLYSGAADGSTLGDIYTAASGNSIPAGTVAPFAAATLVQNLLTGSWEYAFGYVPAGDYTLVFSCALDEDDPVDYDGLQVPLPSGQIYSISLANAEQLQCDLAQSLSCS